MSETPLPIHLALAEVKRNIGAVAKNDRHEQQKYNFRGVDAVVNACAPELNRVGVIVVPSVEDLRTSIEEIGKNRTQMQYVLATITYTFVGPAGDSLTARVVGEAMDSGDKATSKAFSVAYRIALIQVLNLPTDQPDPDESSYERSPARREPEPADPVMIAEWQRRVEAITTPEGAAKADSDLRQVFVGGGMSSDTAAAIRAAIAAKSGALDGQQGGGAPEGDAQVEAFAQRIRDAKDAAELQAAFGEIRSAGKSSASIQVDGKPITLAAFTNTRRREFASANGHAAAGSR